MLSNSIAANETRYKRIRGGGKSRARPLSSMLTAICIGCCKPVVRVWMFMSAIAHVVCAQSMGGRSQTKASLVRDGLAIAVVLFATLAEAQTTRVLLIGDSWAELESSSDAFGQALQNAGLGQFDEDSVAAGGSTASEWANTSTLLDSITDAVTNTPTIDIFFIQLGGNDFFRSAVSPSTESEFATFWTAVWDDIQVVIDHIQTLKPNAKIVYSNYDYPNDGDGMHLGLRTLGEEAIARAERDPDLFYLNTLGLAHHLLGVPGQFSAGERPAPGGFPDYVPLAGGDLTVPGNANAFIDSNHYTPAMYLNLAELAVDQFISGFLTEPKSVKIVGNTVLLEVGHSLELMVSATGLTPPWSVQWFLNEAPLAGETGDTLVREMVQNSDAGTYTISVDDGAKDVLFSAGYVVRVVPMGSLPVAGWAGLVIVAGVCIGWGARRRRLGAR